MDQRLVGYLNQSKIENEIKSELYRKYDVKKGLRNEDHTGVLVGLTQIADVIGYRKLGGKKVNCEGELIYRGYRIDDLLEIVDLKTHCGFEKVAFLLLFGHLPSIDELNVFMGELKQQYELPFEFKEHYLMRMENANLMNKLQQAVLSLYSYDENGDDASIENTLAQGLSLLGKMPALIAYAQQAKNYHLDHQSLIIHPIRKDLSFAQSILYLLRKDQQVSDTEIEVLDSLLILHADHGGGNNSTFANIVISSTGTDFYSSVAGSIGSLKGPRHGGANLKVCEMMEEVIRRIGLSEDENVIREVVDDLLKGCFYDRSGLVYGMGHAIYTLSDPRSILLQQVAEPLAKEKGMMEKFRFYQRFEKVAKEEIKRYKGKEVSSNVDFYSGLVYEMLDIPKSMITMLFVAARMVGWLAYNIEEKCYCDRIIRPANQYVGKIHF